MTQSPAKKRAEKTAGVCFSNRQHSCEINRKGMVWAGDGGMLGGKEETSERNWEDWER